MPDLIKNAPTLFGKAAKPKAIPLHIFCLRQKIKKV